MALWAGKRGRKKKDSIPDDDDEEEEDIEDFDEDFVDDDLESAEWEPDDKDLSELEEVDMEDVDLEEEEVKTVAVKKGVKAELDEEDDEDDDDEDEDEDEEDEYDEDDEEDEEVYDEYEEGEYEWDDEDEDEAEDYESFEYDEEEEEEESAQKQVTAESDEEIDETIIFPYMARKGDLDADYAEFDPFDEQEKFFDKVAEDVVPLKDDPNDPLYNAQKRAIEESIARRQQLEEEENLTPEEFLASNPELANLDIIKEMNAKADEFTLTMEDIAQINLTEALENSPSIRDEPFIPTGGDPSLGSEFLENAGISDEDLIKYEEALDGIDDTIDKFHWNKVEAGVFDRVNLSNETWKEIARATFELDGSAYNATPWFIYDLNFNVSNLLMASIQHNPGSPILLEHWYPQLVTYKRYQHIRDREFKFTYDDVNGADMEELQRYYAGFGYPEIPKRNPGETGIIEVSEMEEDEIKMAAFETWMTSVYNPEMDKFDFDEDSFEDKHNVFSKQFEETYHPELPTFEEAEHDVYDYYEQFRLDDENLTKEEIHYRDMMAKPSKYEIVDDEEFRREFRGHLVIAIGPIQEDIDTAEKITVRMRDEFGKKLYVETRVFRHARVQDNVFEVWLESFEIELLHSRKRANSNEQDWDGPADCDDEQIEYLVEEVGDMISDQSRDSTPYELDYPVG